MPRIRAETLRVVAVCLALIIIPGATLLACSGHNGPNDPFDCTNQTAHPTDLACTGLYAIWSNKEIATDALSFEPGYPAWSDGMEKQRWIALPPGAKIDTSDPDEWRFPIGTRAWKEFRHGGKRIETRFAEKLADGSWMRTTFRWSADGESAAPELTAGEVGVEGTSYEIPSTQACATCHRGRMDGLLGFDAVSLAAPGTKGLTTGELASRGLLTHPLPASLSPPGDARATSALGWLHANCGTACHNGSPGALARFTGLNMRLDVATLDSIEHTNTYKTAVDVPSGFQAPSGAHLRIAAGDAAASTIVFRASYRDASGQYQMPPLGVHTVDEAGIVALRAWIDSMPRLSN